MKGRMNKKDLDCMVRDADTDNDGFINCKGNKEAKIFHSESEVYIVIVMPEFCLLLCADVAQTEKKCAKKGKLIKIMDESERTDSRSGSTKTLSQG